MSLLLLKNECYLHKRKSCKLLLTISLKVKSEDIERNFHAEKSYNFKFGKYNYKLSFDLMQQENLGPDFFTKRNVIRRPVFQPNEP